MPNHNSVTLIGNLTRDIELKHTPSNMAVGTFGLAINRKFKTKDGETKEETTFVDCEAWGRTAETLNQYIGKGAPLFVIGRLKTDSWKDKDGSNRSKLKVVVEGFQFLGGDKPARSTEPAKQSGGGGGHTAVADEDIPFSY